MTEHSVRCAAAARLRSYGVPGPGHWIPGRPSPGTIVMCCGVAVISAQTAPAVIRFVTGFHWLSGNHTHCGSPTSPGLPRGGAVCTIGLGGFKSMYPRCINSPGVGACWGSAHA
ncbi:hypothetical protein [Actinomadura chibensis]|uniref:Uncharacterized protein n=1 Tax=Actinomadura chibensis TaxID=392828 RepID=A0A5D0NWI3_9ACTN|nr:hypothetical protein [Actinomadura chibensis]TYB48554.1 hypothetical protein FXF69_05030 [Actinomadura chibensis]